MVIYVSDSGVFRTDSTYPYTNTASVNRISPLKPTDASTESVVRDAQKAYVAETTPAYTVNISSMGKAAVKSMKSLSESMNNMQISADNNTKTRISGISTEEKNVQKNEQKTDVYQTSVDFNKVSSFSSEDKTDAPEVNGHVSDDTSTASSVNTNNLSRYSDYQLQQMLNDGTITRSEYNSELEKRVSSVAESAGTQAEAQNSQQAQDPVMKQAVAAYNYQMAYQINAAITQ